VLFVDRVHAAIADPGLLTLLMVVPLAVLLSAALQSHVASQRTS
jgi:hypothetical protein